MIAAEMLSTKVVGIRLNEGTFSYGFAREFDGVRGMCQTVEDGIGQCWVGHGLVPCIKGCRFRCIWTPWYRGIWTPCIVACGPLRCMVA